MAFSHPTKYRFYIQRYQTSMKPEQVIDIEEYFNCRYVSLANAVHPEIKNTYSEDFAEQDGSRLWVPLVAELAHKTSDVTLSLRWRSDSGIDVQEETEKFYKYVVGQKLEYHDTFRPNKYWQLILTSAPTVTYERLYGDFQYVIMAYKFTNFGGRIYNESQL